MYAFLLLNELLLGVLLFQKLLVILLLLLELFRRYLLPGTEGTNVSLDRVATAVPAAVENTAVPALSVACCYHAHEMFLFKSMLWPT